MPGVPSGRGCEACRIQKKKAKPSCSRCTRLQIACVGAGQQRYKFVEQYPSRTVTKTDMPKSGQKIAYKPITAMPEAPSNELTVMANAFIRMIKATTDVRYNLVWSYGGFLRHIPQRLGRNEALDASVRALIDAHSNFCLQQEVTKSVLVKYSSGLSKLRSCLDDPIKARTPETLCAVMILLVCQGFIGTTEFNWTGHCEGAAQILKARSYYDPNDEFESKLVLSLRGPVLFEALMNRKIKFTAFEWKTLIENHLDEGTGEGQMMRCLARAPDFMRRGRLLLYEETEDPTLLRDMRTNYEQVKEVVQTFKARFSDIQENVSDKTPILSSTVLVHSLYQRSYDLALTIAIMLNCILSSIDFEQELELQLDATAFAKEILSHAASAARYKPMGSAFMLLCLGAAWVGTTDSLLRSSIETAMVEYQQSVTRIDNPQFIYTHVVPALHMADVQLRLLDNEPV
ncbi:hypothetical protein FQN57_000574 [Myotisia sp. PD_48]|nr:hypothetical protein FQN57_000574 [Myotisia sp. PD_48]